MPPSPRLSGLRGYPGWYLKVVCKVSVQNTQDKAPKTINGPALLPSVKMVCMVYMGDVPHITKNNTECNQHAPGRNFLNRVNSCICIFETGFAEACSKTESSLIRAETRFLWLWEPRQTLSFWKGGVFNDERIIGLFQFIFIQLTVLRSKAYPQQTRGLGFIATWGNEYLFDVLFFNAG